MASNEVDGDLLIADPAPYFISATEAGDYSNRFAFDLERTMPREFAPDEEDLRPLVDVAVWTPLLGAHAALQVLADALLERGKIHEHDDTTVVFINIAPACVLEQALAWARAKHLPSMLSELRATIASLAFRRLATPRYEFDAHYGFDIRHYSRSGSGTGG